MRVHFWPLIGQKRQSYGSQFFAQALVIFATHVSLLEDVGTWLIADIVEISEGTWRPDCFFLMMEVVST